MKEEINSNSNFNNININNNFSEEKICPYCNLILSSTVYQDHIFCHELDQRENGQVNNINNYNINANNNNNNNNGSGNNDNEEYKFGSKIKDLFGKIGGKVETFIKEEKEEPFNKIKSLVGNIKEKIEQKRQDNIREENNRDNRRSLHNNLRNIFRPNTFSINERNNYRNRNRLDINRNNNRLDINRNNNSLEINMNNNRLESNRNNNNNIRLDNRLNRLSYNRRHRNRIRDNENIDDLLQIFEEEDEELNDRRTYLFKEDAKEIMSYIPVSEVKEIKQENGNELKCMICLYDINIGERECTLPCLHIFHPECLEQWIVRKRLCPVCKYDISLDSLLSNNFG